GEVNWRAGAGFVLLDDDVSRFAGFDLVLILSLKSHDTGVAFGPVEDVEIGLEAAGGQAGNQRVIADALAADAVEMQEPGARRFFARGGFGGHGNQPDQKRSDQQPAPASVTDRGT